MRIAFRTSHGRGEYELAGSQGDTHASDLYGKDLIYEITPEIRISAKTHAISVNGKPRIRTTKGGIHVQRILSAILLLPKPIREIRPSKSSDILANENYAMASVEVDVVKKRSSIAILRPTRIQISNQDQSQFILFPDRLSRICNIWEAADTDMTELGSLVRSHKEAIINQNPNPRQIEITAISIRQFFGVDHDVLPLLEHFYNFNEDMNDYLDEEEAGIQDDDSTTPIEAQVRQIIRWRRQAMRGAKGRKFSLQVKQAYDYRCMFSGTKLPKTVDVPISGVDASHIIPWRSHDLDIIQNGICLNKLCHWAFDIGLLKLDFNQKQNQYNLSIRDQIGASCLRSEASIKYFKNLAGPISISQLPDLKTLWPSPSYIAELNKMFDNL